MRSRVGRSGFFYLKFFTLNTINQLLREVQIISESYDRLADATGEKFNIFSLLKVESDEVTTHSRFIAELLDRKGTHRQGSKFLKKFIDCFEIDDFDTESSDVIVEHFIGNIGTQLTGGRIDIFMVDKERHVILIENKIYANEQADQLKRYHTTYPTERYYI